MGIAVNSDGEIVLTLDDNYGFTEESLRKLGYGKSDGNYVPTPPPVDIPVDAPSAGDKDVLEKILDREINPKTSFEEFMERTVKPMVEAGKDLGAEGFDNFNDFLLAILPDSYKEDIISKKPTVEGVPGSDETLDVVDMFRILEKEAIDKRKEEERMTFPEKELVAAPGSDLEENIISKTPVKNEKKEENKVVKKDEEKDPTPEKDDRTKIGKIMDGLLKKDDFLMDLGLRLLEGEGLFPGAIKAAKVQKEADVADKKAELEALELASKLNYNSALAAQAEAYAIKAGLPSEKIQEAQIRGIMEAAKKGLNPGDDGYDAAYIEGFTNYLDKEDVNPFLKNIDDAFMFEMLKDKFPQLANYVGSQGSGQTTAGTTGTFDSPVGPVELNINDYLK